MGRDRDIAHKRVRRLISIHSPRMGRDIPNSPPVFAVTDFNPLSPHGERRHGMCLRCMIPAISIHSPRMGRDGGGASPVNVYMHFNPLSPHGERRDALHGVRVGLAHISIHSPRMGRDLPPRTIRHMARISIHSPRMGRDGRADFEQPIMENFNPLSPHGERHSRLPSRRVPH